MTLIVGGHVASARQNLLPDLVSMESVRQAA